MKIPFSILRVGTLSNAVTVTASGGLEREVAELPQSASVITRLDIARRPNRILPDVFREEAGVQIQQTTLGQGVAFLRGIVGTRVLVLVDGVRLNNSTFRLGPIQYLSTIDPSTVERVEIVRGPSSS
ncbi:MAG TPA: Plug domain-containing protein, partial [Terriglobia bacterium]|nr:Plug domain-containing protein [Terriglobia bacterium]